MKVAHFVYILIVVIFMAIIAILYQKGHPLPLHDHSKVIVRKDIRYEVKARLVDISPGKGDCLGKIEVPAMGKNFLLYFLYENYRASYEIARISVEDESGKHVTFDSSRAAYEDSINEYSYIYQNNKYYEFLRMSNALKCHVKPNYSRSLRIIIITPSYIHKPTYIKIVQAGKP